MTQPLVPPLRLVLASASPRRAKLLRRLGVEAERRPVSVDEVTPDDSADPLAAVAENARRKAEAARAAAPDAVVLGADTILILDDRWIGKPATRRDAQAMLAALTGRSHQVATAVSLVGPGARHDLIERTTVFMRALDRRAIDAYHAAVDPLDKAGAYNIDEPGPLDGGVVERIEGSYSNVMGLPIERLAPLLQHWGLIDRTSEGHEREPSDGD